MEQNIKNKVNGLGIAKVFSIFALLFAILSRFIGPILLDESPIIIWLIILVTAPIFLMVYAFGLHSKIPIKTFFLIIFSWFLFYETYSIMDSFISSYSIGIIYVLYYLGWVAAFVLVLINFIKGFRSKALSVLAAIIPMIFTILDFSNSFVLVLRSGILLIIIQYLFSNLSIVFILVSLLVLGAKNVEKSQDSSTNMGVNYFNMPPETALKVLYDELCKGNIAPEEYRKQREQIISRL